MKIDGAGIMLASERSATQKLTTKESLRMWVGDSPGDAQATETNRTLNGPGAEIAFSRSAMQAMQTEQRAVQVARFNRPAPPLSQPQLNPPKSKPEALTELDKDAMLANIDPNLWVLKMLIEKMTDRNIEIFFLDDDFDVKSLVGWEPEKQANGEDGGGEDRVGWGLEYDFEQTYFEAERTSVSATGVIQTADGRSIAFDLQLNMSREYMTHTSASLRLGDATTDPLVINFNGSAAALTDKKFLFDLNVDGVADEISFVKPDSGFLALDKNGDGVINNGSELFGPQSGNGFQDLATYDEDGNGWIDESDSVYRQLQVWVKNGRGEDKLVSLADKGIGAIYLKPVQSEFAVKDSHNEQLGQVRTTSLYATEDGQVGTVQQIDLAL